MQKSPPTAGLLRQSLETREITDWVVELTEIKLAAHHAVCRTSLHDPRNGNFSRGDTTQIRRRFMRGDGDSKFTTEESPPLVGLSSSLYKLSKHKDLVVGATGIEPVTPTMSR